MRARWCPAAPHDAARKGGRNRESLLGMEHRQVMIGDGLDSLRAGVVRQLRDLRGIQVVRLRQPLQAALQQILRR